MEYRTLYIVGVLGLSLISCSSLIPRSSIGKIVKVYTVFVPKGYDLRFSIKSKKQFDERSPRIKDTVSFLTDGITIPLGEKVTSKRSIDIRACAVLTMSDGREETVLITHNGLLIYEGRYYQASREVVMLLRGELLE